MRSIGHTLNESYEAVPATVARARADVARFAAARGASPAQVDNVRLAVSEAVTNAIRHGYRWACGPVQVSAAVAAGELWILIGDEGCGMRPHAEHPGLGLGLGLIAQVSDHMTIVPRAAGGTELRMRFDLAPAEGRTPDAQGDAQSHASSSAASFPAGPVFSTTK